MKALHTSGIKLLPLCRLFGVSSQSYYQRKDTYYEREVFKGLLVDYATSLRKDMPRLGCYKLYEKSKVYFSAEMQIGRDAYFNLLRDCGLMLRIKKRRRIRTTDSNHPYKRYPDLINGTGFVSTCACQLWVSDITYIPLSTSAKRFCYLSLITDAYSRKIIGWKLADSLQYKHTEEALMTALKDSAKAGFDLNGMIHHSDRGVQYAYPDYIELLKSYNCRISMTQSGDPRDNAIAERVNGILKVEWLDAYEFTSLRHAKKVIAKIIDIYNNDRPHMGIGMKVPNQMHRPTKGKCA